MKFKSSSNHHQANSLHFERLEHRDLMAADVLDDSPVLDRTPAAVKIYTVLPLGETNSGGLGAAKKQPSKEFSYYVTGNAADAAVNATSSGLALMGGGTDVDEVFRWLGGKANGGDFIVLRASGNDAYDPYIDELVPSLDSVATLVVSSVAGANDPFVAQKIREAEAIFIAGGDQANYINFWSNTALESAIYESIARGAPLGGTSAGLAVLSEFDFGAVNGSITSSEALANPYDPAVALDSGFVNETDFVATHGESSVLRYLDNLITDSHFQQRDRFGRLVTFVARIDQDGAPNDPLPLGIGVNEQTALLIEENGLAQVVGNPYVISKKSPVSGQLRNVYLLSATANSVETVAPGQPLTYVDVSVVRADYDPSTGIGDTFNFNTWVGSGTTSYTISSTSGVLSSTQASGSVY